MGADFTFLKGNIETIILSALYENDKYGYELAKEIKKKTSNKYEVKQPTLYAYLRRLQEDDLIVSYWGESSNGGRRRYYKITKNGKENYERFMSEWTFQKTVMDDLVDSDAATTDVTQNDVTPLFGRKSTRRKNKGNPLKSSLDEQDEIARRLSALMGAQQDSNDVAVQTAEDEISTKDVVTENDEVDDFQQVIVVEDQVVKQEEKTVVPNDKSRFDVNQENADVFIKNFEERAREVAHRDSVSHDEGENYQHVLLNVIGDQLENVDKTADTTAQTYYEGAPTGLEEVADSFAKEGIRVRIYNHATAVYKSKMLIPLAKVLCETSWITYALAFIYFGILALTFNSNWSPFVITLGALLVVPIAFSIHAIIDPTRKDKPAFNFKVAIIVTAVIALIIVLCAVGFSAIDGKSLTDPQSISVKILIPVGIAILLPTSVSAYYFLYRKY